jgi:dihydroorotase
MERLKNLGDFKVMESLLIKNGRVVDPKNKLDRITDILIEDGVVAAIGKNLKSGTGQTIDATGLLVTPGLIDLHVHFREPGREDRETLETASWAALAGGITSALAMPNVNPVADNQSVIEFVVNRARQLNLINIYPVGAITKSQGGSMLAEINELKNAGAIAVSDDGLDVQNEGLLRRAMEYAKTCGILLMSHCEIDNLIEDGQMHEGWVSSQLGLAGMPAVAEDLSVIKNILLAEETGARVHIMHISTAGAVRAIDEAKRRGLKNISSEVAVQHFSLTDEECLGYNTNAKMYPPLRSQDHVNAVIAGIKKDLIDAFCTDHAPHIEPDKIRPFQDAARGTIGLQTSFAAANTYLAQTGRLKINEVIAKMTLGPAQVAKINKGHLSIGADADIAIFDPNEKWTVDAKKLFSKSKNSVFDGKKLIGKAIYTVVGGEVKYDNGQITV